MAVIVSDTIPIRPARLSDDTRIAAFMRQVFEETYGSSIPPRTLARYFEEHLSPKAMARDIAQPRSVLLIAAAGNAIHGSGRLIWREPPDCVAQPGAIELGRFYVAADRRGTGLAQALLAACERAASGMRATHVWLCAWEHNSRALAFYRRSGYAIAGKATIMVGNIAFQDHVLLKALP